MGSKRTSKRGRNSKTAVQTCSRSGPTEGATTSNKRVETAEALKPAEDMKRVTSQQVTVVEGGKYSGCYFREEHRRNIDYNSMRVSVPLPTVLSISECIYPGKSWEKMGQIESDFYTLLFTVDALALGTFKHVEIFVPADLSLPKEHRLKWPYSRYAPSERLILRAYAYGKDETIRILVTEIFVNPSSRNVHKVRGPYALLVGTGPSVPISVTSLIVAFSLPGVYSHSPFVAQTPTPNGEYDLPRCRSFPRATISVGCVLTAPKSVGGVVSDVLLVSRFGGGVLRNGLAEGGADDFLIFKSVHAETCRMVSGLANRRTVLLSSLTGETSRPLEIRSESDLWIQRYLVEARESDGVVEPSDHKGVNGKGDAPLDDASKSGRTLGNGKPIHKNNVLKQNGIEVVGRQFRSSTFGSVEIVALGHGDGAACGADRLDGVIRCLNQRKTLVDRSEYSVVPLSGLVERYDSEMEVQSVGASVFGGARTDVRDWLLRPKVADCVIDGFVRLTTTSQEANTNLDFLRENKRMHLAAQRVRASTDTHYCTMCRGRTIKSQNLMNRVCRVKDLDALAGFGLPYIRGLNSLVTRKSKTDCDAPRGAKFARRALDSSLWVGWLARVAHTSTLLLRAYITNKLPEAQFIVDKHLHQMVLREEYEDCDLTYVLHQTYTSLMVDLLQSFKDKRDVRLARTTLAKMLALKCDAEKYHLALISLSLAACRPGDRSVPYSSIVRRYAWNVCVAAVGSDAEFSREEQRRCTEGGNLINSCMLTTIRSAVMRTWSGSSSLYPGAATTPVGKSLMNVQLKGLPNPNLPLSLTQLLCPICVWNEIIQRAANITSRSSTPRPELAGYLRYLALSHNSRMHTMNGNVIPSQPYSYPGDSSNSLMSDMPTKCVDLAINDDGVLAPPSCATNNTLVTLAGVFLYLNIVRQFRFIRPKAPYESGMLPIHTPVNIEDIHFFGSEGISLTRLWFHLEDFGVVKLDSEDRITHVDILCMTPCICVRTLSVLWETSIRKHSKSDTFSLREEVGLAKSGEMTGDVHHLHQVLPFAALNFDSLTTRPGIFLMGLRAEQLLRHAESAGGDKDQYHEIGYKTIKSSAVTCTAIAITSLFQAAIIDLKTTLLGATLHYGLNWNYRLSSQNPASLAEVDITSVVGAMISVGVDVITVYHPLVIEMSKHHPIEDWIEELIPGATVNGYHMISHSLIKHLHKEQGKLVLATHSPTSRHRRQQPASHSTISDMYMIPEGEFRRPHPALKPLFDTYNRARNLDARGWQPAQVLTNYNFTSTQEARRVVERLASPHSYREMTTNRDQLSKSLGESDFPALAYDSLWTGEDCDITMKPKTCILSELSPKFQPTETIMQVLDITERSQIAERVRSLSYKGLIKRIFTYAQVPNSVYTTGGLEASAKRKTMFTRLYKRVGRSIPIVIYSPNTQWLVDMIDYLPVGVRCDWDVTTWEKYSPIVVTKVQYPLKKALFSVAIIPTTQLLDEKPDMFDVDTSEDLENIKSNAHVSLEVLSATLTMVDMGRLADLIPTKYASLFGISL